MKLDRARLWVDWTEMDLGVVQFTCYAREVSTPVGIAWCHVCGIRFADEPLVESQIDLSHIYVPEIFRRNGVAWALHRSMFCDYKASLVKTQNGSATGGLQLIQALGYRKVKIAGVWVLTKATFLNRDKEMEISSNAKASSP